MSLFKVNVKIADPKKSKNESDSVEALVDTGAELSWIPSDVLESIGITRTKKRSFLTARKQTIQRDVGYAILRSEGFETIDEVVFAGRGDMILLGVRTIEGFGVMVDNIGHRFVARATLAV